MEVPICEDPAENQVDGLVNLASRAACPKVAKNPLKPLKQSRPGGDQLTNLIYFILFLISEE